MGFGDGQSRGDTARCCALPETERETGSLPNWPSLDAVRVGVIVRALQPMGPLLIRQDGGGRRVTRVGSEYTWVKQQLASLGSPWGRWVAVLRVFNRSLALLAGVGIYFCRPALLPIVWGKEEVAAGGRAKAPGTRPRGRLGAQRAVPADAGGGRACVRAEAWSREGRQAMAARPALSRKTRVAGARWGQRWRGGAEMGSGVLSCTR